MEKQQKNREIIENMVKNAPGFRGNEDLLEEMCEECLKKAASFLESAADGGSQAVYVKKIVTTTVVDILKRADKIRAEKIKKSHEASSFQEVAVAYLTDANGRIIGDSEIEIPETENEEEISVEKIEEMKNRINNLDRENPEVMYGKIFELRFVKGMGYQEMAEKLEKSQEEILKTLQDIFREVKPFLAG